MEMKKMINVQILYCNYDILIEGMLEVHELNSVMKKMATRDTYLEG
jgi:hypothetical protein